jgi:C4-dicarboxylate-specific signal transduction histidine kinase
MDSVDRQGLRFFGNITASVSHELKNALAIIGQNAGLLQDYMAMAAKGRPVDPARFDTVAARIDEQTRRADRLIKYLNRFAHTVDDFSKTVDLNEILDLLELLSARVAAMRQVELACRPAQRPVMVTTAPFLLLTLVGRLLWSHLQACSSGCKIIVSVAAESGGEMNLETLAGVTDAAEAIFPSEERNALLTELAATARIDAAHGRIAIRLNQPVRPE